MQTHVFRWCYQNSEKLKEMKSPLEFNLHRLNFIQLLKKGFSKQNEALAYSRNFTPFAYACQKGKYGQMIYFLKEFFL